MKVFDFVLGSAVCLFGVLIGVLFLKSLDFDHLAINRKLVIGVVVPVALVGIGVRRIFKRRGGPAPS
jgi:hypothetical protein